MLWCCLRLFDKLRCLYETGFFRKLNEPKQYTFSLTESPLASKKVKIALSYDQVRYPSPLEVLSFAQ
jgi:hypothetical protein